MARWSRECPDADLPEIGRIYLANTFFDRARHSDEQSAILLHETIHLHLQRGRLRRNYEAIEARRNETDNSEAEGTSRYAFMERRGGLAIALADCVQEISCDRFVHAMYESLRPGYFKVRNSYYFNRNAYLPFKDDQLEPPLQPYLTLYRLIRAETGKRLYKHDPATEAKLSTLHEEYRAKLEDDCDSDRELLVSLRAAKQAIQNVRLNTEEPDENDYMDLFDLVVLTDERRKGRQV
jgi:hypothetical protein